MDYFQEVPFAITICDKEGKIIEMNEKSVNTFVKDGKSIIGNSLFDCHPEPVKQILLNLMENPRVNCYTIEKKGIKKLIYQSPWYKDNEFAGYIELSMEIPFEMKHFIRK